MPDAIDADGLTVGQVSARLGVTVRALHHWDETGLARPSLRTAAGYRLYTAGDLDRCPRSVKDRLHGAMLAGSSRGLFQSRNEKFVLSNVNEANNIRSAK
jgi:MerR family transcriptional regulator, thiopeptide resistance regulator